MKKYILFAILIFSFIFFIGNSKFKTEEVVDVITEENITKTKEIKLEETKKIILNKNTEKEYLMGKFNPSEEKNFTLISKKYTNKNNLYTRNETYNAFISMRNSALKDKIILNIISATRNFNSQKSIWENKWSGLTLVDSENLKKTILNELERFKEIIKFSSVPGISRHHWGSDIDINSVEPNYFNTSKGKEEYNWLSRNAKEFGFCQPYNKGRVTGYDEEKWHWTYLPISKKLTQDYQNLIRLEDINGFLGEKYVTEMDLINNYVLSINTNCL